VAAVWLAEAAVSCSLYWRPVSKTHLGGFRRTVRDEMIECYGSGAIIDENALEFLRGLAAAKLDGAKELIDAIEQHGEIQIFQEC